MPPPDDYRCDESGFPNAMASARFVKPIFKQAYQSTHATFKYGLPQSDGLGQVVTNPPRTLSVHDIVHDMVH